MDARGSEEWLERIKQASGGNMITVGARRIVLTL